MRKLNFDEVITLYPSCNISPLATIYPGVSLGENVTVEDFCIIGYPIKNYENLATEIGSNSVIRSHVVIYAGNIIGSDFHAGHKANIRELNIIGNSVSLGTLSIIEHNTKIYDFVRIHSQAFIPEFSILEEGCWIGPQTVITNSRYPLSVDSKNHLEGVVVGKNAKLGANCTVLPGVKIGENSLIGAGSVITKNVEEGVIALGNPCATISIINKELYPYKS